MTKAHEYDLWTLVGLCLAVMAWLIIEDGPQAWFAAVYAWQDIANIKLFP